MNQHYIEGFRSERDEPFFQNHPEYRRTDAELEALSDPCLPRTPAQWTTFAEELSPHILDAYALNYHSAEVTLRIMFTLTVGMETLERKSFFGGFAAALISTKTKSKRGRKEYPPWLKELVVWLTAQEVNRARTSESEALPLFSAKEKTKYLIQTVEHVLLRLGLDEKLFKERLSGARIRDWFIAFKNKLRLRK